MENLPTTVIGLVGFMTAAYIGSMVVIIRYFLTAQKAQTTLYMDYIEKKNGNLERTAANFEKHIRERDERHAKELDEREAKLRECLISK